MPRSVAATSSGPQASNGSAFHASRNTGSQTMTSTPSAEQQFPIRIPANGTLRLRAESLEEQEIPREQERHVQWANDVVNNENMGKKSSKVCCIYHKPSNPDESSDDSSSDSSSESGGDESDNDDGAARPSNGQGSSRKNKEHGHNHSHGRRRINAYEKQPSYVPLAKKQSDQNSST